VHAHADVVPTSNGIRDNVGDAVVSYDGHYTDQRSFVEWADDTRPSTKEPMEAYRALSTVSVVAGAGRPEHQQIL
jgi:hypothetical protein